MDKASIGGVFLAIAGIVAGLLIEGGNLGQILQPTAALIVFGGTHGRGAAPVPAYHGCGRLPQPGAHLRRAAQAGRPTDPPAGRLRQQGAPQRRRLSRRRPRVHPGPLSQADPHARRRRHRARGLAQDHARHRSTPPPKTKSACPRSSNRPAASRPPSAFWAPFSASSR